MSATSDAAPFSEAVAAEQATELLKALANPGRLRILCLLADQDRSVREIEDALEASQSYVSGQLLRLRKDGLVSCERRGRQMQYRLDDPNVRPIIERICEVFRPTT